MKLHFKNKRKTLCFLLPLLGSCCAQLQLESPDFGTSSCSSKEAKSLHPKHFSSRCGGRSQAPAATWTGSPYETGSYVLTITEVSQNGEVIPHLLVWDIPETLTNLSPAADWKALGASLGSGGPYGGPCPSARFSCLRLSLYALSEAKLLLPEGSPYEKLHARLAELAEENVLYAVAFPMQPDQIRTGI